jgi:hypothetical protein
VTDLPVGLARANCRVHGTHRPSIERAPGVFTVENHHIHPKEFGGPDEPDNMVYICPTGHSAVHELLRLEIKHLGETPWSLRRCYSRGERELAFRGYLRIKKAGRLPEVRRGMGLSDQA